MPHPRRVRRRMGGCVLPAPLCGASCWLNMPWGSWSSRNLPCYPGEPIWGHRYRFCSNHCTKPSPLLSLGTGYLPSSTPSLPSPASLLLGPFPFPCQWHVCRVSLGWTPAEYNLHEIAIRHRATFPLLENQQPWGGGCFIFLLCWAGSAIGESADKMVFWRCSPA